MPLATIDLVGWDIHRAIVDNVYEKTKDEAHETLKLPGYMKAMVEKGTLGAKTGGGFFQAPAEKGKDTLVLDPKTGAYRPLKEVKLPDLGFIAPIAKLHRDGRYKEAMRAFVEAPGDYAALSRKVVAGYVSYAFHRVGEATETIAGIDDIMGFGFNWAPPSVLVDTIGAKAMVGMIEKAKLPVPKALSDAIGSAFAGQAPGTAKRFYTNPHGNIGRFFVAA
jgi:3-hydroxyacyl-CoA dehydrogenase